MTELRLQFLRSVKAGKPFCVSRRTHHWLETHGYITWQGWVPGLPAPERVTGKHGWTLTEKGKGELA